MADLSILYEKDLHIMNLNLIPHHAYYMDTAVRAYCNFKLDIEPVKQLQVIRNMIE